MHFSNRNFRLFFNPFFAGFGAVVITAAVAVVVVSHLFVVRIYEEDISEKICVCNLDCTSFFSFF